VPAIRLEAARNWGVALHRMCELYLKDDLDEDTLDEPLRPVLWGLKSWLSERPDGWLKSARLEEPSFNSRLKYAGTPDIVTPEVVIDVKSRPANMLIDSIQVVAYDKMDGGDREHRILVLHEDGSYQYQRVNSTKAKRNLAWSRFRHILELHKMKMEVLKWK
nr:hypothetical protein [Desulfobacteraceae bacterium]